VSDAPKLTDAQQGAAIDGIGRSLALTSGAGCGKTFVLSRRFTELLLHTRGQANPLSRFVALTFTDKAAMEMRQGVARVLKDLAARSKGDDRRRLHAWLEELPEARISTIHGFCAALLRSHAVEAGLDPAFGVCADELLIRQMVSEAAEEAILLAVESERPDVLDLLSLLEFERVHKAVTALIKLRANADLRAYLDPRATSARWRGLVAHERAQALECLRADENLRSSVAKLEAARCDKPSDRLLTARAQALETMKSLVADPPLTRGGRFASLGETEPPKAGPRVKGPPACSPEDLTLVAEINLRGGSANAWGGKEALKEVKNILRKLREAAQELLPYFEEPGAADDASASALAAIAGLALEAIDIYDSAKRRAGLLDFDDLIDHTGRLLTGDEDVRNAISAEIDQLLLDEAQDTNDVQVRLLSRLLCGTDDIAEADDGRFFLVGDAKQSIYRFRGAQVEVFEDLCRRLGRNRRARLDVSFRTHPAGIAFINHLFAPLMGESYETIAAHRTDARETPSVELLLPAETQGQPVESAADAVRAQAAATARRIRRMLDGKERLVWDPAEGRHRPVRKGDIAILLRRMVVSGHFERELQAHGIDYFVIGGTGFFRRQEVYDVLNALRAIDNPADDIAFSGALRSALFGLDDNGLAWIAEACGRPYLPALRRKLADEGARFAVEGLSGSRTEMLRFAVELLDSLHRRKDAVGIDAVLDELLDATGYEAVLSAQFHGKRLLGNVRRLVDLARRATSERTSLADFLTQANSLVIEESRYEQAAVSAETEDVVRIMTVHKAKGLEFPMVFVPDLNHRPRERAGDLLHRVDWGLMLKLEAPDENDEDRQPLSYRLARRHERRDGHREDIRLLYVAATRHRDHLVFVGADWRTEEGQLREAGSYLQQMDDVLEITGALEEKRETIPYADGRYMAAVRSPTVGGSPSAYGPGAAGKKLLAEASSPEDLAERILRSGRGEGAPPLLGPLPTEVGKAELAVTALSEFERCPMLYRWRYELRVPAPGRGRGAAAPDALTLGTLFHRCMELLDFARPQAAAALVAQVAEEMELDATADLEALADDLAKMLERFRSHELCASIATSQRVFREMDFLMACGPATLRGQIDLLYEDAEGRQHIVDYKSDRVGSEGPQAHAERYKLQMLLYAAAAARHFRSPPAEATLYFLRTGQVHTFAATDASLAETQRRAASLAGELIRARRNGQFQRRETALCDICPYRMLCEK